MKEAINLVSIQNGSLLLVRKGEFWIFPGGKSKKGESHLETLTREFGEELPGTKIIVESYYDYFVDKTPHSKTDLRAEVYLGHVENVGGPGSEISEVKYINNFEKYNLSKITKEIVNSLQNKGYL